jgi:hypothetical protein
VSLALTTNSTTWRAPWAVNFSPSAIQEVCFSEKITDLSSRSGKRHSPSGTRVNIGFEVLPTAKKKDEEIVQIIQIGEEESK